MDVLGRRACDEGPSAGKDFPYFLTSNGTELFVADGHNQRILIWNTFPTSSFEPADAVLGQSDFDNWAENDDDQDGTPDPTASPRTFHAPSGVHLSGSQLIVTDHSNNRWLIFNRQ